MQFNPLALENKQRYLDAILADRARLMRVVCALVAGAPCEITPLARPWEPGGGATLFRVTTATMTYFLKVKHLAVTVESKLEAEPAFSSEPSLRHEHRFLVRLAGLPFVPAVHGYVEDGDHAFLLLEWLTSFNAAVPAFGPVALTDVFAHVQAALHALYERGIVHTDLHEKNLLFRSETPVLVDFEEARDLPQAEPFAQSLDVIGKTAYGDVGEMPAGEGCTAGLTCLARLRAVFVDLVTARLEPLIKSCNFDSSCPFLLTLDHGKDERVYQSIQIPGLAMEGQRPVDDPRIPVIAGVAARLFDRSYTHLDIGSNVGMFNIALARQPRVRRSIGVEAFDKYVELSKALAFVAGVENVAFHCAVCGEDSLAERLAGEHVDLVTIYSTYHHIRNKERFLADLTALAPAYVMLEMASQPECYDGRTWQAEVGAMSRGLGMPFWQVLGQSADYQRPVVLLSKVPIAEDLLTTPRAATVSAVEATSPREHGAGARAPRVSVVLPVYNHRRFLPHAIESLLAQTYTNFELIVVNDGSTDGTREYLDTLTDLRVVVIHQDNQRLPAALNAGFARARGEFLTWVSADNFCAPMFLDALVAALDHHHDAGFAYSAFAWIDDADRITGIHRDQDVSVRSLLKQNPGIAAFMYRRSCQDAVGSYDSSLEGAEDWDMWLRIIERHPAVYVPEILYYYRLHDDSMTATKRDRIAQASRGVIVGALARRGGRLDIHELFPALPACGDRAKAEFYACLDFGTSLLQSPWAPVDLAVSFLDAACSIRREPIALAHFAIACGRVGRWQEMQRCLEPLRSTPHAYLRRLILALETAAKHGRADAVLTILPSTINQAGVELFERERRRVFSFTDGSVSTPPASATPPPASRTSPRVGQTATADPVWSEQVVGYLQQAETHFLQGDLPAARDALREALVIAPRDPQLIIAYGNIVLRLGDAEDARREFVKATILAPDHAPAHLNLAGVLLMLGRTQEAEASARRALALNPTDADALKLLGRLCLESGRAAEAIEAYASALRQRPNDVETLLVLGKCAVEAGDPSSAQAIYERVLQIDSGNKTAEEGLAFVKSQVSTTVHTSATMPGDFQVSQRGEPSERQEGLSAASLTGSLRSDHRAPMVSVIVPTYNRPDTLVDALRSILNQTYQDFEVIVVNDAGCDIENIVRFLDKDGRITYIRHGANRNLAAARNTGIRVARGKYIAYLDDDDLYHPDHLQTLVTFLEQSKCKVAYTDAYRAHQEKRDGRYVVTKRNIPYSFDFDYDRILVHNFVPVLCFMHERACLDAVGLFDESLTTHEDWELWIRLSRRFQFAHIKKVTCEFSSRTDGSTMTSSKLPDFRRTYAIILERYKASAAEKPHIRAAQERLLQRMRGKTAGTDVATQPAWPAEVIEQVRQAEQYLAHGDPPAAAQALGQALQLVPHDPELIVAHGNVLLRLGDVEAARLEFVKATALSPEYAPAFSNLAAVLLHLGRLREAEAIARQALTLNADDTDALKVLARVCLDSERYAEAVQAYVAVLRLHPDDVETLLVVGNCYAEAGRPEDATTFYQRVLQLDPGNTVAAENLIVVNSKAPAIDRGISTGLSVCCTQTGSEPSDGEPVPVSIIIPVFNRLDLTRQCLESIRRNTPANRYEIIVVDNGSSDGTTDFFRQEQQAGYLRVVWNNENIGFAKACNQGARAAKSDYLLFLNNDTVSQAGWLEPLCEVLDRDHSVAAVGSKLLFPDGALQHAGVIIVLDERHPSSIMVPNHIDYKQPDHPEANRMRTFQSLTAACLLVRRTAFEQAGGFDEGYWNGYEDVDLCFTLQVQGWKLVYRPESLLIHHESQGGPERFVKEGENLIRLNQRWLAKCEPDFIIKSDGSIIQTDAGRIQMYKLPTEVSPNCLPSPIDGQTGTNISGDANQKEKTAGPVSSIIILTHNGLEDTRRCLASIEAHTPEPHELIIVDNASTDGTLDYLRDYMATHDNVLVVANRTNRGFAAGNNQGLALARGDYLLLLNNDTIVTTGWLQRMLQVFEAHPDVGIVGPMSNYVSGPQLVRDASYKGPEGLEAFAAEWAQGHDKQSAEATRVVGFCLATRKEVVTRIGGLDEQFGSGNFEDDDFCVRAFQVGFRARIALDVFIHHTGSQTFKAAKIDYRQSLMRNWELFKAKWGIPADAPYEKGYRFPPQTAQGSDLSIPLSDVGADHRCEDQGRWWQEISERPGRSQPAVTEEAPLSVVIIPNGHGLAPLWPSLVQHTNHSLAITVLPSNGNGNGADPTHEAACPEGWQVKTGDLPSVRILNQLMQSADDDPVIVLSSNLMLTPGWLKRLLVALKRDQRLAAVGPTSNHGATPQRIKADYKGTGKALRQFALRRAHRYGEELAEVDSLAPFCIVFKGSVCRAIGPLREDLDLSASLHDYFARLRQAGRTVAVALDAYVHWEESPSPASLRERSDRSNLA